MAHRKMKVYGEREHGGKYILKSYTFSRNHRKASPAEKSHEDFVRQKEV